MSKTARRPNPARKRPPKKLMPDRLRATSPPRTDQSRMELVYITPEIAAEWLERNTENRPFGSQKLAELKQELMIGRWMVNGETIKFCTKTVLRDGQTRLKAIVDTGISAWCWVCYDLDPKVFDTIDQGRNRNLGQLLAIRKRRNYNALAQAIKVVFQLSEDMQAEPGGFVPRIGLKVLEEHRGIEESLEFVTHCGAKDVYSLGTAAGLHYLMKGIDPDKADYYWEHLCTGAMLPKRSPIQAVRDVLNRNKLANGDGKLTPTTLMAIVIKGWRLFCEGRTCKYVRWNGVESFPKVA